MSISDDLEYQETLASFRHYSNFRLAILTLFFTISGGISAVLFWESNIGSLSSAERVLCLCVSLLSLGFGLLEWLLSRYLNVLERHLRRYPDSHFNRLTDPSPLRPSYVFRTIYGVAAVVWIFIAAFGGS